MSGLISYNEALKREVVYLVKSGNLTKAEASRKFGIKEHTTVLKWIRKFEGSDPQNNINNTIYLNESNDLTIHNRSREK